MLTLTIRFLAGRYHATGWDHQVNEGTVEWPPSPWRLLRALVAASHRLVEAPSEAAMLDVLSPLAEELPSYRVPPYSEGHTRHYMPNAKHSTQLIFNAFVVPGSGADADDGEVTVVWPRVELGDEAFGLLDRLCDHIPYLGRAESWAAVTPSRDADVVDLNCEPAHHHVTGERVRLMAPARQAEHQAWLERATGGRKSKGGPPRGLMEVLTQDTGALRKKAWSSVPGARWVVYDLRRRGARRRVRLAKTEPPTTALYHLHGPVLPSVKRAFHVGIAMHKALVSWDGKLGGVGPDESVFVGTAGGPGSGQSGHAAVLPVDMDGDGRLDHVVVHARDGFGERARRALELGRHLWRVGPYRYRLTLVGTWTDDDLERIPQGDLPGVLRASRRWRSATPLLLVRHPRRRADGTMKDGVESQVLLELERRGVIGGSTKRRVVDVSPVDSHRVGDREVPWYTFARDRKDGPKGQRAGRRGYGVEVEFDTPARGPIAIGYGRFFGLGQLEAVDE